MASAALISDEYLALQRKLHERPDYGVSSIAFAPYVRDMIREVGAKSLSDYGAGKMKLRDTLRDSYGLTPAYFPYDPAFPEYGEPKPADLVCCIDVLEHIEPEHLDAVLDELKAITVKWGFFTVHTGPAKKVLADGRNAHLIQEPVTWWLPKLQKRFTVRHLKEPPGGFYVIVSPKA